MKQENKEKIAQAEEILERLKEQRGGNVLSIHKKMANDPNCSRHSASSSRSATRI